MNNQNFNFNPILTVAPHQTLLRQPPTSPSFDVTTAEPGAIHDFSNLIKATPQTIVDGTYLHDRSTARAEDVRYLPRIPQNCGRPSFPGIVFSYRGRPGPYVLKVCSGRTVIDCASDPIFEGTGWTRSTIRLDWPHTSVSGRRFKTCNAEGGSISRAQFAKMICEFAIETILDWREGVKHLKSSTTWGRYTQTSDLRDLRLVAANYYSNAWVPVFAIDVVGGHDMSG